MVCFIFRRERFLMIAFTLKYLIRNAVKIAYEFEFTSIYEFSEIHEYKPFLVQIYFPISCLCWD